MNNDTSLYEILDNDPGSRTSPPCTRSSASSALLSLGPTTDAFLLRSCRRKPEGEDPNNFTYGLALIRSYAELIPGALSGAAPLRLLVSLFIPSEHAH